MKKYLLFSIIACITFVSAMAQPKIVAHRGYWRTEGSAQNSLSSLLNARQIGCYGSEFDVWLTKDGVPVVTHDALWNGVRIENATYPELMSRQLANGEFLPTLLQYLQLGKQLPEIQLILEIKTHKTDIQNDSITRMTVSLVKKLGLEKQVEYIAFSKRVCKLLYELTPDSKIAYLNGDLSPREVVEQLHCNGIDYNVKVFEKHPEWLKEAHEQCLEVNVWTVDGEEGLLKHLNTNGIDIITTNDPDILKKLIADRK